MGEVRPVTLVKLVCGIIASGEPAVTVAVSEVVKAFGAMDMESEVFPFDFTEYYEEEMGPNLLRKFVSFSDLVDPAELAGIKLQTNKMEKEIAARLSGGPSRPVNLDPGYICAGKLVLATTKDQWHRVFLRDGIYAEVTLSYIEGKFAHHEWTYPDYRTERYKSFFMAVRRRYMEQIAVPSA